MSSILTDTSEAAIFSRLLEQENAVISPEAARSLLALDFSQVDRDRINALSAKARQESRTQEEDQELENFIRVGDLLGIMQSKARRAL